MNSTVEAAAVTRATHAVSPDICPAEASWHFVKILGTRALISYQFDADEDARRRRSGLAAVATTRDLDLMMSLPVGMGVPLRSLTTRERTALRTVPRAAVAVSNGYVVREAIAPVRTALAVVSARTWRTGLEVAGRFAPFCSRAMLLRSRPRDMEDLRMQATFYGIGVLFACRDEVEMVVAPAAFRRTRFTSAGWWFAEEVYRQVR